MQFFSNDTYQFVTSVTHQGKIITFATNQINGSDPQTIEYRILSLKQDDANTKNINEAIDQEGWGAVQTLAFPTQVRQGGMSLLTIKNESTSPAGVIPPIVSEQPILTANSEFQIISDDKTLFFFRQSTSGTLLVDQFIMTIDPDTSTNNGSGDLAFVLKPKWEVRFRRSGNKDIPESQKDGPGFKSMDGQPFVEPTLDLSMVSDIVHGRFTVSLAPSIVMGESMWHIFYYNNSNQRLELCSIPKTTDNPFDLTRKLIEDVYNSSGQLQTAGVIQPDMSFKIDNGALQHKPSSLIYTKQEYYDPNLDNLEVSEGMKLKRGYRLMLANTLLDQRISIKVSFSFDAPYISGYNFLDCYVKLPSDAQLSAIAGSQITSLTIPQASTNVDWDTAFEFNVQLSSPGNITIYSGGITQKVSKIGVWVGTDPSNTPPSGTLWISGPHELHGDQAITLPIQPNAAVAIRIIPLDVGTDGSNNQINYEISQSNAAPVAVMDFGIGRDGSLVQLDVDNINLGDTVISANSSGDVEITGSVPQLYEDQNGLTIEGTVLSYLNAAGSPILNESSEGAVKLYFQKVTSGSTDANFCVNNFNPELGRAVRMINLDHDAGTLNFIANKLGSQYTNAIVNATGFNAKSGYAFDLELKIPAYDFDTGAYWVSEYWQGLPRNVGEAVAILNGDATNDVNDPGLKNHSKQFFDFRNRYDQLYLINQPQGSSSIGVLTLISRLFSDNSNQVSAALTVASSSSNSTTYSLQVTVDLMPFRMVGGYTTWSSSGKKVTLTQTYHELPHEIEMLTTALNGQGESFYPYMGNSAVTPAILAKFTSNNPFVRMPLGKGEVLFLSGNPANYTLAELYISVIGLNSCNVKAYFKNATGEINNRLFLEGVPRVPQEFIQVIQGTSANFDYATKSIWQTKQTPPPPKTTVMEFVSTIWNFLNPPVPEDEELEQWPVDTSQNVLGYSNHLIVYDNSLEHEFSELGVGNQYVTVFPYFEGAHSFVLSQSSVTVKALAFLVNVDNHPIEILSGSDDECCAFFAHYPTEQLQVQSNTDLLNLSMAVSPASTAGTLTQGFSVTTSGDTYRYLIKSFTFKNVRLSAVGILTLTITLKDSSSAEIASFKVGDVLKIGNLYGAVPETGTIQNLEFLSVIKTESDFDLLVHFPIPILLETGSTYSIEISAVDSSATTGTPLTYKVFPTVATGGTATFNYSFEHIPATQTNYEFWTYLPAYANLFIRTLRGKSLQYDYAGRTAKSNHVTDLSNGSEMVDAEHALLVEELSHELSDLSNIESLLQPIYSGAPGLFHPVNVPSGSSTSVVNQANSFQGGQSVHCDVDHLMEMIMEHQRTLYFTAIPQVSSGTFSNAMIGETTPDVVPTSFSDLGSIDIYGIPTSVDCGTNASLSPTTDGITIMFCFNWIGVDIPVTCKICSKGTFGQDDFCYDVRLTVSGASRYLEFRIKVNNITAHTSQICSYKLDVTSICTSTVGPYSVGFTAKSTDTSGSGSVTLTGHMIDPENTAAGLLTTLSPIDGSLSATASTTFQLNTSDEAILSLGGGGYFILKGVQVWNAALTSAEMITNVLFGGTSGTGTHLVSFWPFTEDHGLIARDVVGNNDGQLTNEMMFTAFVPATNTQHLLNNWELGYAQKAIELLANEYISYEGLPSASKKLDVTNSLTMEAWVKPKITGFSVNDVASIINYCQSASTTGTDANFSLNLKYMGTFGFKILATRDTQQLSTVKAISLQNDWNHISAMFRSGNALNFTSGYAVNCGNKSLNPGSEGFTLMCWVKITTAGSAVLMSKRSDSGVCYELTMNASRQVTFSMDADVEDNPSTLTGVTNNKLNYSVSLGTLNLGEWTHLAVAVQFKTIRDTASSSLTAATQGQFICNLYKSFVKASSSYDSTASANFSLEFTNSAQDLLLGISNTNTTNNASFQMAGIQYWNRGISLNTIRENSAIKGISSDTSGLVSFWPCDQGETNIMEDKQHMNNGVLTSNTMWVPSTLGAETAIYLNGIPLDITTEVLNSPAAHDQFTLGGVPHGSAINQGYIGAFTEIRIWDIIRTREEILDTLYGQLDGREEGLLMYLGYEKYKDNLNDLSLGGFNGTFETPIIQSQQFSYDLQIQTNYEIIVHHPGGTIALPFGGGGVIPPRDETIRRTARITVEGTLDFSSQIKFLSKTDTNPGEVTYQFNVPGTSTQSVTLNFQITYRNAWKTTNFEVFLNGISQNTDTSGTNGVDYTGVNRRPRRSCTLNLTPGNHAVRVALDGTVHRQSGNPTKTQSAGKVHNTPICWQEAQPPVGGDIPQVSSFPAGNINQFSTRIIGPPTVQEYGDLQVDDKGDLQAIMKRFYAYLDSTNKIQLSTGFKIGEAQLSFVGQVQTKPTLKGFIEGPPPVPSENLTENDKSDIGSRFTPVDDFDGTSSLAINKEKGDQHVITTYEESGMDSSTEGALGIEYSEEISGGFGILKRLTKAEFRTGFAWSAESSASKSSEKGRSTEFSDTLTNEAIFHGHWEMPKDYQQNGQKDWLIPEMGKRYEGNNKGYALVESETADLFALRMKKSGVVIGYQTIPNTDIPKDTNIIMFNVNPEYTKYSTLDGMVGLVADPVYPQAKYGIKGSYFKPVEAYERKARIQKDKQRILAYYDQMDPATQGSDGDSKLPDWVNNLANRDIVNSYIWTAKGGFFTESEEYATTHMQVEGGEFEKNWKQGFKSENLLVFGIAGPFMELDSMRGQHRMVSVVGENEDTSTLNLELEVTGNRWLRKWDWERKDYLANDAPGKVESYRFMTFYLSPKRDHFDSFYDEVVDENWLYNSASPDAIALLEAKAQRVPIWRSFHRVTYVNRIPPPFELTPKVDLPPAIEKPVNLDSNVWLIHIVSSLLDDPMAATSAQVGNAVESVLNVSETSAGVPNPHFLGNISPWWQDFRNQATQTPIDMVVNNQFLNTIENCKRYIMNYFIAIRAEY